MAEMVNFSIWQANRLFPGMKLQEAAPTQAFQLEWGNLFDYSGQDARRPPCLEETWDISGMSGFARRNHGFLLLHLAVLC